MFYKAIIAVCSQIHTKHINTVCGQNVELLNVKVALYKANLSLLKLTMSAFRCGSPIPTFLLLPFCEQMSPNSTHKSNVNKAKFMHGRNIGTAVRTHVQSSPSSYKQITLLRSIFHFPLISSLNYVETQYCDTTRVGVKLCSVWSRPPE